MGNVQGREYEAYKLTLVLVKTLLNGDCERAFTTRMAGMHEPQLTMHETNVLVESVSKAGI